MIYIFFDERYKEGPATCDVIVPAVLVHQARYNNHASQAKFQSQKTRTKDINSCLEKIGSYAHLGFANVKTDDFKSQETDIYNDVQMRRRDHIWSLVVSLTLCDIIAKAITEGEPFRTIDIYHDPKTLRLQHEQVWKDTIKNRMLRHGNELIKRKRVNQGKKISIRRLTAIEKAERGKEPNKFQRGIWIADQLGRGLDLLNGAGGFSRMTTRDFSSDVNQILQGMSK